VGCHKWYGRRHESGPNPSPIGGALILCRHLMSAYLEEAINCNAIIAHRSSGHKEYRPELGANGFYEFREDDVVRRPGARVHLSQGRASVGMSLEYYDRCCSNLGSGYKMASIRVEFFAAPHPTWFASRVSCLTGPPLALPCLPLSRLTQASRMDRQRSAV